MPKALVLSNGSLLVNLHKSLQMSDFYFPHVGMEDHTAFRNLHKIGVYVDHKISWLSDNDWQSHVKYHTDSLVGNSYTENPNIEVKLHFEDLVTTSLNIFLRRITIKNTANHRRNIKLFFHSDFHIYGDKLQDTAEYDPYLNGIMHYRKKRYFLVSGIWEKSGDGLSEFACGKANYMGKEGTWRDAEDGKLGGNSIEQGSVDSTICFSEEFDSGEEKILNYFVLAGTAYKEIEALLVNFNQVTPKQLYFHTLNYWKHWSNKQQFDFSSLDDRLVDLFKRSILIIKSQIDRTGAIIAANDSDIIKFNKDTYTYMWPRDASIAVMAMNRTFYSDTSKEYFKFCSKLLTREGYMLHKYNPDGSLGSSWHPKFKNGEIQLPIQEDETALPLIALNDFYNCCGALEFINELYESFVKQAANFLVVYVDNVFNLPLPSYDLWEEQRGIFTYTTSTVYGGLMAAANMAEAIGFYDDANIYLVAAHKIKEAALELLYDKETKRFVKKVVFAENNLVMKDLTVDASLAFVWRMGMLPADDPRVISTMNAVYDKLWTKGPIGGLARYENDFYQREFKSEDNLDIVGNPWIVTTMWYAMWKIRLAKNVEDLKEVEGLLHWVCDRASEAGIFPEQSDPFDGRPLSVAPLTWSHSEYVLTILEYKNKLNAFLK